MTTQEKCEAILRKMLEHANRGQAVTVEQDWGANSATVTVGDSHTHVGYPGATWDVFVSNLHGSLCEGRGLSWEAR